MDANRGELLASKLSVPFMLVLAALMIKYGFPKEEFH